MNGRFSVPGVDARSPLSSAAPLLLLAKAQPLFSLEKAVLSDAGTDAVHDMRVASRRLREALLLFAPAYDGRAMKRWRRRVRSITRALGPVRDADVFVEALRTVGGGLGEGGQRAVAFLTGYSLGQRERDLAALRALLPEVGLAAGRRRFERAIRDVRVDEVSARPLFWFARDAITERMDAVCDAQSLVADGGDAARYHALRIAYKRLRYAVEVFAPCYRGSFRALHDVLSAFQDALGEMHDGEVFSEALHDPQLVSAAARARVGSADLAEVSAAFAPAADAARGRFVELCAAHPADVLRRALLAPLESDGE